MKLVDDIIESIDSGQALSASLRKCLVLAHQLKNERLRTWAEKELNGYEKGDTVPSYQETTVVAKGTFLGPLGAAIYDQPIPAAILARKHRDFAERVTLRQPIAAYEKVPRGKDGRLGNAMIEWPA